MTQQSKRAVFLDRDGTLMEEVDYCRDPDLVRILPGVREALQKLKAHGFLTLIVTNQSGIGRGRISLSEYESVQRRFLDLVGESLIDATYYCADAPDRATSRRKPNPGMVHEAAAEYGVNLSQSWMVGDKSSDIGCGKAAGLRSILVETGYGRAQDQSQAELIAKDFASAVDFILKQSDAH